MHGRATIPGVMWTVARATRLLLCTFWAGSMLLCGLWIMMNGDRVAMELSPWLLDDPERMVRVIRMTAIGLIAGAQFLFMFLVADDLCPDAPMLVSGFLELTMTALMIGAMSIAGLNAWAMMP